MDSIHIYQSKNINPSKTSRIHHETAKGNLTGYSDKVIFLDSHNNNYYMQHHILVQQKDSKYHLQVECKYWCRSLYHYTVSSGDSF